MKISIPVDSQQGLGGGFSFARNLTKGLRDLGHEVVTDPLSADIALISGVTMVTKETVRAIKEKGVKLIARVDNVPRNSRNRGTGTSRLRRYCELADEVVYQGDWARYYLKDFTAKEGVIVHNGIDLDIFNPEGATYIQEVKNKADVYIYSRFNRDETKQWELAWYKYQLLQRMNPNASLLIVGKFSQENIEYDFDFFRGERYSYLGIIDDPVEMGKVLRCCGSMLATYSNDAFSNTYLEALCTGVELYQPDMSGGTPEMLELFGQLGREYFSLERMAKDYLKVFEDTLNK